MNPKHLTPNVREQVALAIQKLREIKNDEGSNFKKTGRAFESEKEVREFFDVFYQKIKDEVDNSPASFLELCVLEDKYGFVSGYMGGGTLGPEGGTVTI